MMLTELVNYVSRLWTPPARLPGRQTMTIPYLRDLNSSLQAVTVAAQCDECAKLLASHLFVWRRPFPQSPTLKTWDPASLAFQGMDLDLFRDFVMRNFVLKTADQKEWLLDRSIAAAIWGACVAEDSPLLEVNWQTEMDRKRAAVRLKEDAK